MIFGSPSCNILLFFSSWKQDLMMRESINWIDYHVLSGWCSCGFKSTSAETHLLAIRMYVECSRYGSIGGVLKVNPQSDANWASCIPSSARKKRNLHPDNRGSRHALRSQLGWRMQLLAKNIQLFVYCYSHRQLTKRLSPKYSSHLVDFVYPLS